ncbi:MAG TPA: DNA recombination protein RmuC [Candidatus Saccharimonadales bacterium]
MEQTWLLVAITVQAVLLFGVIAYFMRRGDNDGRLNRLDDSLDKLTDSLNKQLGENQKMMVDNIHKQFSQSAKLITDVTKNLTELKETNKQVVNVTDELKTLQNILQNPKQRGVLGEYYLQTVLENVLPPERFSMQYRFKDGSVVDAAIFLDKNKVLPIDSKFSLENYNRLIEEKDSLRRAALVKQFKIDLKNRIDETAKYIRPNENTMDFAFMFIPSEAIYYDLLINKVGEAGTSSRDLVEYAFRDKNVIIVSPTSFMAYLQTVMQGLRSLQIEERAKEIQKGVGQLGRHIGAFDNFMQKLGNSLGTTVNHFNSAHKELGKIDKDVVKIADADPSIEPLLLDKPETDE